MSVCHIKCPRCGYPVATPGLGRCPRCRSTLYPTCGGNCGECLKSKLKKP